MIHRYIFSTIFFFLILSIFSISAQAQGQAPFVTTWKTDNPGVSNSDQITIPTDGSGYNYHIYWEKVGQPNLNNSTSPLTNITGNYTIQFPEPGIYRVEITGDFPRIYINGLGDKDKLLTIEQWGDISWTSMREAFSGATNLQLNTTDPPNLSGVTDLSGMFKNTANFNQDLSSWDVSHISSFQEMFENAVAFNGKLDNWKPGFQHPNGASLNNMFKGTQSFNQDLSSWDVSYVSSF